MYIDAVLKFITAIFTIYIPFHIPSICACLIISGFRNNYNNILYNFSDEQFYNNYIYIVPSKSFIYL